jgi:hypothetical protein
MILARKNLGGHDISLVANASGSGVGFEFVLGRADDDDKVIPLDFALHEMGKLVSGNRMRFVEADIYCIGT